MSWTALRQQIHALDQPGGGRFPVASAQPVVLFQEGMTEDAVLAWRCNRYPIDDGELLRIEISPMGPRCCIFLGATPELA